MAVIYDYYYCWVMLPYCVGSVDIERIPSKDVAGKTLPVGSHYFVILFPAAILST